MVSPEFEIFEPWLQQKIKVKRQLSQQAGQKPPVYEIPVVVHVLEPASGGSLNISDDRIIRQIEIMNEDFRRTNADAINTPTEFLPVAADTEIQFVLAKQDPLGNPTSGIVRTRGSKDIYSARNHQAIIRSESYWPPENYLNIHVLNLQTFLGWASFPFTTLPGIINSIDDSIWDGVLIDSEYFGDNPTASAFPSFGRTASHEVGHYLGLRHIWGDGGCGIDDFVSDTPEADSDNGGLSSPCTFPSNDNMVCDTDEMFQNYMDYTDDGCMNLFTEGQKTRMRTVLENSPRRISLLSSPGLLSPTTFSDDLAITKIISPNHATCANSVIPIIEVTNYGDNIINSFDATFSVDGLPLQILNLSASLDVNESQQVTFNSETFPIRPNSLEFLIDQVNGGTDGNTSNNTAEILFEAISGSSLPFLENFESDIKLLGENGNSFPWQIATAANDIVNNNALSFKAFQNTTASGEDTWIKTPVFNLNGINSAELKFSFAYAQTSDSFWDGLVVKVSEDCGSSFTDDFVFSAFGPDLTTATSTDLSFVPSSANDWEDTTINITGIISQFSSLESVQFAFAGQNGSGNNIYIDDIAVTQTNINPNDISITEIEATLLTCGEDASALIEVRNVGFEEITSLVFEYSIAGITQTDTWGNLSVISGEFQSFIIDLDLIEGLNQLDINVTEVNGLVDDDTSNNTTNISINKDSKKDTYPLIVDFDSANDWITLSQNDVQLWSSATVASNSVLRADGFSSTAIGSQSWFISPTLDVGALDSAGLSFKVSYAERAGFNDQLQVLMSVNCGETYNFELLNADSDSLAITQSSSFWTPISGEDWKEFKIDLKPFITWKENIRLAFVFTNGNGNNLYIDDINIGIKPTSLQEGTFRIFPNPAHSRFNIAIDLAERSDVQIQIMDVSGKIIFSRQYKNVLDQVYDFDTLSQDGFYFVKITGDQINQTERMYIRR